MKMRSGLVLAALALGGCDKDTPSAPATTTSTIVPAIPASIPTEALAAVFAMTVAVPCGAVRPVRMGAAEVSVWLLRAISSVEGGSARLRVTRVFSRAVETWTRRASCTSPSNVRTKRDALSSSLERPLA